MANELNRDDRKAEFLNRSSFYRTMLAERMEIDRHKWIESEKLGCDIGFDRALLHWIRRHRDPWRDSWRQHGPPNDKEPI